MAVTFVVRAQYDSHVPNIPIANLDFDDLTVAALAPPTRRMQRIMGLKVLFTP